MSIAGYKRNIRNKRNHRKWDWGKARAAVGGRAV
jgi:hypothetical protein